MNDLDIYAVRVIVLLGDKGPRSRWDLTQAVLSYLKGPKRRQVLQELEGKGYVLRYTARKIRIGKGPKPDMFELTPRGRRMYTKLSHTTAIREPVPTK